MSISRADGQPLLDSVEEAREYWKRNFAGFLANFSLERGEGGCLPAFVFDSLLQSRPEIFDRAKESNARRVGFFGNKLDLLLQEGKGVLFHVRLWANGVKGLGQIGLGVDRIKGKWIWPAPTWQTTTSTSCNNRSSLFPKKATLPESLPLGRSRFLGGFEEGCERQRLEGNLLPHSQGKKTRKVLIPIVLRLFNTIWERLAICARDRYRAIHC